ncbi:MAG: PAC2 family protein [Aigarchaeota archaeon]|nr:PAC2 family protein [Aigarchaeota archaeon]MCX8193441.1 PAC2 family protein [Nitrososphaeria archaeon]MDW7985827.1 PAC2 family protein [Nitrososphaerota archaeon]
MMEELEGVVEIVEVEPTEGEGFIVVEGFPDVGLVGTIAASFLADRLQMKEVGYIESDILPPIISIRNGKVLDLIRLYRKNNLIVVISEIPIPLPLIRPLSQKIVDWAMSKNAKMIISLTGMPEPARLDIDTPRVFVLGSNKKISEDALKIEGVTAFTDGFIAGVKGMILRESIRKDFNALLILSQAHFNYPDPGSAAEVLRYLSKLLSIDIDIKPLLESAEELKLRLRDLMRRTSQAMQDVQKSRELELPAVYL